MIEGCARHGIRGISPWRDKLAEMGAKEAARAIRGNGLYTVNRAVPADGISRVRTAARQAATATSLRAIDDAALEARCPPWSAGSPDSKTGGRASDGQRRNRRSVGSRALGARPARDRAAASDVLRRPGLREHARPGARPVRRTGRSASGALGVPPVVDVYHVWWTPRLKTQIERAGGTNGLLRSISVDWLVPTTEPAHRLGDRWGGRRDRPPLRFVDGRGRVSRLSRVEILSRATGGGGSSGRSARDAAACGHQTVC